MSDNRFAMMYVNRCGPTSRSVHGNEAVQTGSQGARVAPTQRYAHADARRVAGRGGSNAWRQPADNVELGQQAGRGSAGVATQPARTSRRVECRAEASLGQGVGRWRGSQRLSQRAVDVGAGSATDRARVWTR